MVVVAVAVVAIVVVVAVVVVVIVVVGAPLLPTAPPNTLLECILFTRYLQ